MISLLVCTAAQFFCHHVEPGLLIYFSLLLSFFRSGGAFHIVSVDLEEGSLTAQNSASASELSPASLVALETGVVALSGKDKICAAIPGKTSPTCSSVQELLGTSLTGKGAVTLIDGGCKSSFVVQFGEAFALVELADGNLKQGHASKGVAGLSCSNGGTKQVLATTSVDSDGVTFHTQTFPGGKTLTEGSDPTLRTTKIDGTVVQISSTFASATGDVLVQLEEGTLAFFSGKKAGAGTGTGGATTTKAGAVAWLRHEALASVNDLLFTELPAPTPENEAQWAASQPSVSESFQFQILALKVQIGLANPWESAAVEKYRTVTSDRLRPTRDPDGFRRQLILATAAGKIVALHTGDGRVLWSLDFGAEGAPTRLAPWRTPHDLKNDALVVAFHTSENKVVATVINAHTGKVESTETVESSSSEIIPLGSPVHVDNTDQYIFVVLSSTGKASAVLPRTDAARAAFAQQAQHLVHWRVSSDKQSISGFGLTPEGKEKIVWSMTAAPKDSDLTILTVAAREPDEVVYSAARPIPGGGIILKHLSPNTILVVAGPPADAKISKSSKIVVSVLDAATGKLLFSQVHAAASGPLHGLVSENWAAYHFWSIDTERWQIGVLDGYHPAPADLSVLDLALGRPAAANATEAVAADPSLPVFERQVFTTRLAAATLGVTQTAHGTAAKMLLIGTPNGQVYMMDRRYLDPRRPIIPPGAKPTPDQQAEMLPPYQPENPIAGQLFATLDRKVGRLSRVAAVPAVLESASLMVAVGLDTFYARLQPSKGFDMVPDDFPHALLVAMVGGMGVALFVLRAVLQQRALKLKWQ